MLRESLYLSACASPAWTGTLTAEGADTHVV